MDSHELSFVIPTYRLRDVSDTIEQYDQHFWKNGHALTLIVFDDSSPANQQKYFELLERTARDTKLKRDVAITLPSDSLQNDPERLVVQPIKAIAVAKPFQGVPCFRTTQWIHVILNWVEG